MNFTQTILRLVTQGASAYISARSLSNTQTRPDTIAGLHLAEVGAVPFLEALSERAAREGDSWLAESLLRHAQDERRHGAIFAQALKRTGRSLIDFQSLRTEGKGQPRSPFFEKYFEGHTAEELKAENIEWGFMMASTHVLEDDAQRDFVRMANALPAADPLRQGMYSIAADEGGHAAYLKEALVRRLGRREAEALIETFRVRKVEAIVALVGEMLQKGKVGGPELTQNTDSALSELAQMA
ncbi:ferritin-like domain-containing protein [Candidatus Cyanaurora vandensis]|uniref:ferritin-like domain-containing protein n=1 Tax=Candidatus Cyanaurora vandensis TaxID=2714958 RepID=UPI00257EBAA0|nr:ferritin-like domain-containing protein [Candidatus Cyanaurora vandensis]